MPVLHDGFKGVFYRGIFDETVKTNKIDVKATWQKHANSNTDYLLKLPGERRHKLKFSVQTTDCGYPKCITKYQ